MLRHVAGLFCLFYLFLNIFDASVWTFIFLLCVLFHLVSGLWSKVKYLGHSGASARSVEMTQASSLMQIRQNLFSWNTKHICHLLFHPIELATAKKRTVSAFLHVYLKQMFHTFISVFLRQFFSSCQCGMKMILQRLWQMAGCLAFSLR